MFAFVAVGLCLASSSGSAQAPLNTLRHIYVQQQQADMLQARLDGPDVPSIISLNPPTMNPAGALEVSGWAFACGQADGGRLVVMIDGLQSVQADELPTGTRYITRSSRPDVNNPPNSYFCWIHGQQTVPTINAGFFALVDVSAYSLGWLGDGCHTVQMRMYDAQGRMAKSVIHPACW
jgi:hypothetical protein